ncbi:hypothetical protein BH09ACT13_BH09ACT13_06220 [soil metagenome]
MLELADSDSRDVLAERVDALASWIQEIEGLVRSATAVGDAPKLKELASVLDAWSKHDPELESRLTNRVDVLADRLATLAGTVSATASALAARDGEIAALRRELSRGQRSLATAMLELGRTGAATDLAELRNAVAALSVERDARRSGNRRDEVMPAQAEVLAERIDTLAKTVATTAAGLAGREGELATLRRSLDDRGAQLDAVADELRRSFAALSAQVAGHDGGTSEGERATALEERVAGLGAEIGSLAMRVDAIAILLERAGSASVAATSDLTARLDAVESKPDDVELDRIHAVVDGLRMRLAGYERELTAGAGSHDVVARIDELARRLDSLEQSGGAAGSVAILPIAGEGHFRVELRALELRLEDAEEAARESREVVLTQLERLASRVEWRLQRLETPDRFAPPEQRAPARELGVVVPIRGEARGEV